MEIGTEISRKIRTAIKGKLQELGAYADEELPDYIMVMVANKKSQEQMAEDLALFLGSNTLKFTVWLHGVLDKLRSVTVEPTTAKQQPDYTESNVFPSEKSQAAVSGSTDQNNEDVRILAVSSTRPEKTDSRVTTSSLQEQAIPTIRTTLERSSSPLTSAVKPLTELVSCEAVIDIKPEPDDLIDGDLNIFQELPSSSKKKPMVTVSYNVPCPSFDTFAPEENVSQVYKTTETSTQSLRVAQNNVQPCKLGEGSFHGYRLSENTGNVYRSYENTLQACNRLSESGVQVYRPSKFNSDRSSRDDEGYKKRKASIISSVVKINKSSDGEEDDDDFGSRTGSLSSSISVPAKPERRPTLPPSKQANKNLILKAITEAQKSVAKTTSYPAVVLQKQMVPVAPRTRAVRESSETEVINPVDKPHQHDVQLQTNAAEQPVQKYYLQPIEAKPGGDTRSFILKKPELEGVESQLQGKAAVCVESVSTEQDRQVQSKDQADSEESSPKFIVTLDGIPSPGSISEQDEETEPLDQGSLLQEGGRKCRVSMQSVAQTLIESDEIDDSNFQAKRQKILERCKYWPACKNGDDCMYHHPVSSCKTFPKCKYGDKCLFIHPNCKYDSKCTRLDCPYTHASRRTAIVPKQPAPVTSPGSSLCRFFPDCKKVECSFIHPKPCRFSAHCKRADCTFYHPTITLPPRHALKWIRSQQNSE